MSPQLIREGSLALMLLASLQGWAQVNLCVNTSYAVVSGAEYCLSIGLNFMTHVEIRGGELPKSANGDAVVEDRASDQNVRCGWFSLIISPRLFSTRF